MASYILIVAGIALLAAGITNEWLDRSSRREAAELAQFRLQAPRVTHAAWMVAIGKDAL